MTKTIRHNIVVQGVSYPYSLTHNKDGTTKVVFRAGRINQIFLEEDLAETIRLFPEYIKIAKDFLAKQEALIQIRISGRDKQKIEEKARKNKQTVSEFIRERALAR